MELLCFVGFEILGDLVEVVEEACTERFPTSGAERSIEKF